MRIYLVILLSISAQCLANNATVGTGTPASCTTVAFNTAIATLAAGGGVLDFNCGANPHTIVVNATSVVSANSTLDGGGKITLDGAGAHRIFSVTANQSLFRDITLTRALAPDFGAAILGAPGSGVTLLNVTISESRGVISGGAIAMSSGSQLTIQRSRFINNNGDSGGALAIRSNTLIEESEFSNNRATGITSVTNPNSGQGGAIQSYEGDLNLRNTRFAVNTAYDGAAIFKLQSTVPVQLTIDTCQFTNNTGQTAGAIETRVTTVIQDSDFNGNRAVGASGDGFGGAVQSFGGQLTLLRSRFLSNTATANGGAVSIFDAALRIEDSSFILNSASGLAGAIESSASAPFSVLRAYFERNSADTNGGALAVGGSGDLTVSDSRFDGNTSMFSGGAVYVTTFGLTRISNTTVRSSRSGSGAIYVGRALAESRLAQLTLTDNVADLCGADLCAQAGFVLVDYSTFVHSGNSPSIGISSSATVSLGSSVIFAADAPCFLQTGASVVSRGFNVGKTSACMLNQTSDVNVNVNDLSVLGLSPFGDYGGTQLGFLPLLGSPLLDRAACTGLDARGAPRPVNLTGAATALCDSGAFERQVLEPLRIFRDGFE